MVISIKVKEVYPPMNARKITYGGLLIAMAILLPQAFHLTGFQQSGQIFLPMHIPVLLSGFILGPMFGMCVGAISPVISSLLTAMPAPDRLPFMIIELAAYGLMAGLLYEKAGLRKNRFGIIVSLIGAMIFGRIMYALSLFVACDIFGLAGVGAIGAVNATVKGIYGILLQLVIIPPIVYALEKSGFIEKHIGRKEII